MIDFVRGTICVERSFDGKPLWMPLHKQADYKEWIGCFSIL